ncbi:MAG: HEAT repeat domain-containing protein [Pirellulaceae bacterium]|nr:HEAT repeat domain-containing protein [Pirellulaceae bacterium]
MIRPLSVLITLCCCLLLSSGGCASGPFAELDNYNPLVLDDTTYDDTYGSTPEDQLQQIREIADNGSKLSELQKNELSNQILNRLSQEESYIIRLELTKVLKSLYSAPAIQALSKSSEDTHPEVRQAACRVWEVWKGPQATQALATILGSDSNNDVRVQAAKSLGKLRNQQSIEALALALDDPDPALQYRAIESLKTITGQQTNSVKDWKNYAQSGQLTPTQQTAANWSNPFGLLWD